MTNFVYKTKAGDEITIPEQSQVITAGFLRKNRALTKNDDQELVWLMLEKAADEENLEKIDELALDEFSDFAEAWGKTGEVAPGESSKR